MWAAEKGSAKRVRLRLLLDASAHVNEEMEGSDEEPAQKKKKIPTKLKAKKDPTEIPTTMFCGRQ